MQNPTKHNVSAQNLSDEDIIKLWHNPEFTGSFRGVRTFQTLLKTDLNIDVPENRLLKIFKTDSLFLMHQKPKRNFLRRRYDVNFYGQLIQIDIAFMFEDDESGDKYFLLAIDVFSFKIFVEPLKDRNAHSIVLALTQIFKKIKHSVSEIQSDQGKEFLSQAVKIFLKNNKTFLSLKYGKNKASFAEYGILLVKRKLYLMLRSQLSHRWVHFIDNVVNSLNNTPLKRLGGLTPDSIHNEADTVFVQQAKAKNNVSALKTPTYDEMLSNQSNYKGDLKIDDYVYLDFNEKLFDKSFDVSVKKYFELNFYVKNLATFSVMTKLTFSFKVKRKINNPSRRPARVWQ